MSSPTYEAIAFLQDDSDYDVGRAVEGLMRWLPGWAIVREGNRISASSPSCEFVVYLAEHPCVAEESRDMAAHFATCPRAAEIAECRRRVEVVCIDPDPDMRYFNDYLFVCHALEEFRGVILFDPRAGELI